MKSSVPKLLADKQSLKRASKFILHISYFFFWETKEAVIRWYSSRHEGRNFIKKRLQNMFFVKFAKFLRTLFFRRLLLKQQSKEILALSFGFFNYLPSSNNRHYNQVLPTNFHKSKNPEDHKQRRQNCYNRSVSDSYLLWVRQQNNRKLSQCLHQLIWKQKWSIVQELKQDKIVL